MKRIIQTSSILGLALIAIGCSPPRVSLVEGSRSYMARDYDDILNRWTRSARLLALSELDGLLTVTATFESWDFKWAYVSRYARDHRLSKEEERALLESELNQTRRYHEFYIALSSEDRRSVDLTKESSAWVVRLIDDRGHESAPEEIIAVRRPGPRERAYYPYSNIWRQVFRVRFPVETERGPSIAESANRVGLVFSGPAGQKTLYWELGES